MAAIILGALALSIIWVGIDASDHDFSEAKRVVLAHCSRLDHRLHRPLDRLLPALPLGSPKGAAQERAGSFEAMHSVR